jgi:hypothetical protein
MKLIYIVLCALVIIGIFLGLYFYENPPGAYLSRTEMTAIAYQAAATGKWVTSVSYIWDNQWRVEWVWKEGKSFSIYNEGRGGHGWWGSK